MQHVTTSPGETKNIAREFARQLQPGDLVLLTGELGTGKTTFVQGIAEGLGAKEAATSPSFVLMREYPLRAKSGPRTSGAARGRQRTANSANEGRASTTYHLQPTTSVLRHLDLYRLALPRAESRGDPTIDLDRIGLPELLNDPEAITVVEWADRIPAEALAKAGRLPGIPSRAGRTLCVRLGHGRSEADRIIDIRGES